MQTASLSGSQAEDLTLIHLGLEDPDPLVPPFAAGLLGELGRPESVDPLLKHVRQSTRYNKNAAVDALRTIGDASAAPVLFEIAGHPGVWGDYFWYYEVLLRSAASLAALVLDPGGGADELERQLDQPSAAFKNFLLQYAPVIVTLPDFSPLLSRLREAAVQEIFTPRALQRPAEAIRCIKALGQLNTGRSLEKLRWYLDFPSRYVRGEAVVQITAWLSGEDLTVFLQDFLAREPHGFAHMKASILLAAAGDAEAPEHLRAWMLDPETPPLDLAACLTSTGALGLRLYLEDLRRPVGHPAAPVRSAAVSVLEWLPGQEALALCGNAILDPDPRVRLQAAKSRLVLSMEASI